jgi:hypothetical protein
MLDEQELLDSEAQAFAAAGTSVGQQHPRRRNDVQILAQKLDLAVFDDEMADIVLCLHLLRTV